VEVIASNAEVTDSIFISYTLLAANILNKYL